MLSSTQRAEAASSSASRPFAATAFFGRTYGDALTLVSEARDYVARTQRGGNGAARPLDPLLLSRETSRLTARLVDIMGWLLMQRAVAAGEKPAAAECRLLRHAVCLAAEDTTAALPESLTGLLARSRALYLRIARLDELLARDAI